MYTMPACLALVALVALTAVHTSIAAATTPCVFHQNKVCQCVVGVSVTCLNAGMTTYPHQKVPSWVRQLNFGFNSIYLFRYLSRTTPHITDLHLHNNEIYVLPRDTLANLFSLTTVDLSNNKIVVLDRDAFTTNTKLTDILLSSNQLLSISIHANQFSQNVNLVRLDLGYNLITYLNGGYFNTLVNLETLILQHNRIAHLDVNIFGKLQKLKNLNLGFNQIVNLPGNLFRNNPDLTKLVLSNSRIQSLPLHLFDRMDKLLIVDLSHNRIQAITPCLFSQAPKLEVIGLKYNRITWIPFGFLADPNKFPSLLVLSIDNAIAQGPYRSSLCALVGWAGRLKLGPVIELVLNNLKASGTCNKINTTSLCSKYSTCSPFSDDVKCSGYDCGVHDFFIQRQPSPFLIASSACGLVNTRLPMFGEKACVSQWLRKSGITQGAWLSLTDSANIHFVATPNGLSSAPDHSNQNVVCVSLAECGGRKFFTYPPKSILAARPQCSSAGARLPMWEERGCVSRWLLQNNFKEGAWLDHRFVTGVFYVANPVGISKQSINSPVRVVCVSIEDCPLTKSNFYFHAGAATTWRNAEAKCKSYSSAVPTVQDQGCAQRFLRNLKVTSPVWLNDIPQRSTAWVLYSRQSVETSITEKHSVLCKRTFGITIPLFQLRNTLYLNYDDQVDIVVARWRCRKHLPGIEHLHLTAAHLQMISVYLIQLLKVPSVRIFMQDNSESPPAEHVFEATASGTWKVTKTKDARAFAVCVGSLR